MTSGFGLSTLVSNLGFVELATVGLGADPLVSGFVLSLGGTEAKPKVSSTHVIAAAF